MRNFRAAVAAFVLSCPGLVAGAQEGGTTEAMEMSLAAGWKAAFICSGTFVAGQTLPEIERNELSGIYPDFQRAYDQLPAAEIDATRKLVSVTYSPDMPPRIAAFRPGFGCTQLPTGAGAEALGFLPRFASWPAPAVQDRGSAIGSDVKLELKIEEAERLDPPVSAAFDELTYGSGTRTAAVIVVRDGQIVAERYDRGIDNETPVRTWSAAKSLTATLIGVARRQGKIDIDYPAVIAAWNSGADPRRAITLRHLLQMASGLDSGDSGSRTDRLYFGGGRVVDQAASNLLEARPGTRFKYANNDTVIAMRALREALKDDTTFQRFPYQELLHKIGAQHTTLEIDWNGDFISSSQVWATARDLARIGQLYLQDGVWAGERLLPEDWVEFVSSPGPAQPADGRGYGAQFWLMDKAQGVPEDTFYAAGNRGQYVVIVPSMNTVIVRQGFDVIGGASFDIEQFTADALTALTAADAVRAAERAAAEAVSAAEAAAEAARRANRRVVGKPN
ncbi:MAG: serine hydrolase [Hyphomonas sp.]|uniref:serine hydrolase domain-containing protein n=1 Tax=Hyphomonas sp. TaxID=87 RepID=UPI0017FDA9E3|nr:serine hydrolase [Hyphomonas sp.]MBA3069429.1 serine hydrolase [Hyphomonas sp.]MBU3919030.1 beta-lactamase family protein [Alphaproteobacteria bacterium]MBU4063811.1 beta-lactamase family protein [Alphaproteobacteria bacterium]MBU4164228.1 beta-lactamase family protein [Alphaproteobacteria bacterium]